MQRLWIPAVLLLCGLVPAQRGAKAAAPPMATPPPLPGIPVMTTTDHPALMAQPLIGDNGSSSSSSSTTAPAPAPRKETEAERKAREFRESRRAGNDLKRAVKSVRDLKWQSKLAEAEKLAAAEGKPIFWVNALGDLDGFT